MNTAQLVRDSFKLQTNEPIVKVETIWDCHEGQNKVIFISGKVTGDPYYRGKFRLAETKLKAKGYVVLNPAYLPKGLNTAKSMAICLNMLSYADCVYMLSNWEESRGATIEHEFASYSGKEIIYESDELSN